MKRITGRNKFFCSKITMFQTILIKGSDNVPMKTVIQKSLPLRTRCFVPIASPWFTATVSFLRLANKTVESIAMGTLDWLSLFSEEQSSVLTTEELQSVKYISRNTSIMNQTSEVAIITLQIWKLRRLMVPDCGERYILCNEMQQGNNYVQKNDILKRWWL